MIIEKQAVNATAFALRPFPSFLVITKLKKGLRKAAFESKKLKEG